MKHQYFGDVHDYVKYGVLRCFAGAGFRVGVCWVLTPDDQRPDGRKLRYLSQPDQWQVHDPALFSHLARTLVRTDGKHLRNIEVENRIPHARFFGEVVPDSKAERSVWYKKALRALRDADLLFFDPDNGIEVPSKAIGQKDSSKFVYWNELSQAWEQARSLLVYQHFPRVKRDQYIAVRTEEMRIHLPGSSVIALQSSNVLYLLAFRPADLPRIQSVIDTVGARWSSRVWTHPAV